MKFRKSAIKELSESSNISISKKSDVEKVGNIIFVDKIPYFFLFENKIIPTLHCLKNNEVLPCVRIDAGAVKFLIKGADMMRPGITDFDDFSKGDVVVIKGPNSSIPIGVGIALFSSEDAKNLKAGKIIKIIHYSGDSVWSSSLG